MANSKPLDTNLSAMIFRHFGWLPILGVVVITIGASFPMDRLAQSLYISAAYDRAAWDAGLRVIDKHGHLSNGDSLSGWGHFFVFGVGGLMTTPFFFGSAFGFTYASMKFHGEQLNEQLATWRSENQP
jgi:hypothetical protein